MLMVLNVRVWKFDAFSMLVQPSALSRALKCGLDGLRGECQNHQMRKNSMEKRQMRGPHCKKMMECLK